MAEPSLLRGTGLMAVRLDVRPCWRWTCPDCGRVFRYPTSKSMVEIGTIQIANHLVTLHKTQPDPALQWEKDHWGWFSQ